MTPVSRWLEPLLRESIQQKLSGQDGADAGELLSAFAFDAHSLEKILEDNNIGICTITKDVVDKTGEPELVYRETAVPRKTLSQRLKKEKSDEIA